MGWRRTEMSDEGVPCYRRMSAPMGAEELEEAAGYLRDAARCIRSALDGMRYTEVGQFRSVLHWCHQALVTTAARLDGRAVRVRDQARREECLWEMSEETSKSTDQ